MLYSLVKYIDPQCENLLVLNSSIKSIRIYSTKPSLLYAHPFFHFSEIPLNDEEKLDLENIGLGKISWHVSTSDTDQIPELYAYKKLYAYNYRNVIGYMELKMNPVILEEYFSQFENNPAFHSGDFALYREGKLIYSPDLDSDLPGAETLAKFNDNAFQIDYLHQRYLNYVTIPNLNLQLVITGNLGDLSAQSDQLPIILVTIFILLLMILLIYFFVNITDLSQQITDFSTYIRNSNPDHLTVYAIDTKSYREEYEELKHLILSYNNLIRENSTLMSTVEKMELLSQDARYQALQAQIHPHFIYGTLENIRMLALGNRDKDVADMIFSLSALIRQSLSISSKAVTLADELEIAKHYLTIQRFRFSERLNFHFQIEEGWQELLLPSFTLQPILENSVIYAVSKTFDECELSIHIFSDEKFVYLELANSGQTITEERLTEINEVLRGQREITEFKGNQNGIALSNIRERLQIYYQSHASICMKLEEDRTVTLISLERSNIHVSDTDC